MHQDFLAGDDPPGGCGDLDPEIVVLDADQFAGFVEAADGLERLPPNEDGRVDDPVLVPHHLERELVRNDRAAMIRQAVNQPYRGVGAEMQLGREFFGLPDVVGIEQREPGSFRFPRAEVPRGCRAAVFLADQAHRRRHCGDDFGGAILRTVVDDKDFQRRMRLRQRAVDRAGDVGDGVVGGDDDGNGFVGHDANSPSSRERPLPFRRSRVRPRYPNRMGGRVPRGPVGRTEPDSRPGSGFLSGPRSLVSPRGY